MRILSLFDGIAGARQALKDLNLNVKAYYASEIDKYAIKVAKHNHPDIKHIGDVCEIQGKDYKDIDLLIGGSPCQGFSFAGKQLNFDDPRSKLFFEYVRLLKEVKPKYFLLENVRMKQECQDIISEQLGVKPIMINSSLLTAQNRVRLYWTNIPNVQQPDDKGIVLRDILEHGFVDRDKSFCLDANYFKGGNLKSYFEKNRRQLVFEPNNVKAGRMVGRKINDKGKRDDCNKDIKTEQYLEVNQDPQKTNCLTTVQKDNIVIKYDKPMQVAVADLNGLDCIKRVYDPNGKSPTLTTCGGGHREPKILVDCNNCTRVRTKSKCVRASGLKSYDRHEWDSVCNLLWRKLTPLECERLQGFPDNYTGVISNTQRYKSLGNSFTVPVISHILKEVIHV